jgi:hypothetical protein
MYTVYKTTNTVNGKYYIGVHKTDDPNDAYLGSGKLILQAIRKYGKTLFTKVIIDSFESPDEAFKLEATLVTAIVVSSGMCYNMKIGGYGGFDLVNQTKDCSDPTYKQKLSTATKAAHERGHLGSFLYRPELRDAGKTIAGWKQSSDAKRRMSETKKRNGVGRGDMNSQAGTMWITNGAMSKKIKKGESIPHGWRAGRNK